jgi:hypothetical protein
LFEDKQRDVAETGLGRLGVLEAEVRPEQTRGPESGQ